jgi:hypothetical protein
MCGVDVHKAHWSKTGGLFLLMVHAEKGSPQESRSRESSAGCGTEYGAHIHFETGQQSGAGFLARA